MTTEIEQATQTGLAHMRRLEAMRWAALNGDLDAFGQRLRDEAMARLEETEADNGDGSDSDA